MTAGRLARACHGLLAVLLIAAGAPAVGADADRRYALSGHGALRLTVPQGWLDEVRERGPQAPPTIVFRPLEGDLFLVLVTPLWRPGPEVPMPTKEGLRERLARGVEHVLPRAVEKEIPVREFAGASGPGFYFSATDRAPKPGEFTYLTQGMVRVGGLIVTFTILSDAGVETVSEHALDMLKHAAHLPE